MTYSRVVLSIREKTKSASSGTHGRVVSGAGASACMTRATTLLLEQSKLLGQGPPSHHHEESGFAAVTERPLLEAIFFASRRRPGLVRLALKDRRGLRRPLPSAAVVRQSCVRPATTPPPEPLDKSAAGSRGRRGHAVRAPK